MRFSVMATEELLNTQFSANKHLCSRRCWITDSTVHYAVNIGYYSIIFLFTLLTFVVMLRWLFLLRSKRPIIPISKKSRPSDALSIMGLCSNMGLSWGFAFFAYGPMQIPGLYIFTILNSLQGEWGRKLWYLKRISSNTVCNITSDLPT